MRVYKVGRTEFNLDALAKVSSLKKALEMHSSLPSEVVEEAYNKAHPKQRKKATSKTKEKEGN